MIDTLFLPWYLLHLEYMPVMLIIFSSLWSKVSILIIFRAEYEGEITPSCVSTLGASAFPFWIALLHYLSLSLWLSFLLTLHLPAIYYQGFLCQSPVWERDKQILVRLAITGMDLGGGTGRCKAWLGISEHRRAEYGEDSWDLLLPAKVGEEIDYMS